MKKTFVIKGMHCNSCANNIEQELKDKVNSINVSFAREKAEIDFDENKISEKEITEIINKMGYEACEGEVERKNIAERRKEIKEKFLREEITAEEYNNMLKEIEDEVIKEEKEKNEENNNRLVDNKKSENKTSNKIGWIVAIGSVLFLLVILYIVIKPSIPEISIPGIGDKTGLLLLFAAGLLTGFHCVAMCGGFVVSYTAKNALQGHKSFKQHLVYGGSKVISYAVIGGIFGLIGGIVAFSVGLRGWVAILAGSFMIFYALGMFGIKFFRFFQFKPKFLTKIATKEHKGFYKGPFFTGLLNGLFIACGPLQAMYLYAAGTGNLFSGASSLFAFGLGTLPVMLGFGSLATVISHKTTGKILKISAIIVLVLGLVMLNRGLALTGSSLSYNSIKSNLLGAGNNGVGANLVNGVQEINMQVDASGYHPNSFVIKQGVPVKWNIDVKQLTSCNQELVMNAYGIDAKLKQGLQTLEFTPDKTGTIQFSCGMGMLHGSFIVTATGNASQQEISAATPPAGGSCSMGAGGGSCGCGG